MTIAGLDPELLDIFLKSMDPISRLRVATEAIELCRDHLLPALAQVRREAATEARLTMRPKEIAEASGHSPQTIGRLLVEAGTMYQEQQII